MEISFSKQTNREWTDLQNLSINNKEQSVWIRGRLHNKDSSFSNKEIMIIRRSLCKIQAIAQISKENQITKEMILFCKNIKQESIVDIYGIIKVRKNKRAQPKYLQEIEIDIRKIYLVYSVSVNELPFNLQHASRSEINETKENNEEKSNSSNNKNKSKSVSKSGQNIRLDNRWYDLRTPANYAIFRIQSGVCQFFREYLLSQSFMEIHTPKILSAASEGGAEVFKLERKQEFWNGAQTFLAQSPQLHKQMAICSDFHKVFEIGPVMRAENSFTHRHLCEFTGLDLEMEFYEHYHEVLQLIGKLFVYVFENIKKCYKYEIETIKQQFGFKELNYNPDKLLILTYAEAKEITQKWFENLVDAEKYKECKDLLCKKKIIQEFEKLRKENKKEEMKMMLKRASKDFTTTEEKLLGKLIAKSEKYGFTDFYCVDKFPMKARPFYTMMDPFNNEVSNSYDFFLRGEEITSGAQRVHNVELLIKQAKEYQVPLNTIDAYINSFKLATSPHAGCGIGLERVVMLYLGLDNIRKTSMFPRDPSRCSP